MTVGGDESPEFHRQNREFTETWGGQGAATRYQAIAGLNHFTMVEQLAVPESILLRQLLELMGHQAAND